MKGLLLAAITIYLLTGCAYQSTGAYEKPHGQAFDTPDQRRIASASHWKLVAENEAQLLKKRFAYAHKLFFVKKNPASSFSVAYHNFLTSSLVQAGAVVLTEDRPDTIKIAYDVQIVKHEGGKQASDLAGRNRLPVSEAAYYILSDIAGLTKVLPAVFGEQMVKNLSSTTEVVITTQATNETRLLHSTSNVYYIDGINQGEYRKPPPAARIPQASPAEWMWNYRPTK